MGIARALCRSGGKGLTFDADAGPGVLRLRLLVEGLGVHVVVPGAARALAAVKVDDLRRRERREGEQQQQRQPQQRGPEEGPHCSRERERERK